MANIQLIEELVENIKKEPQVIGRNTVTKLIGEGAFAYVFESSFDKFGRRKGALKLPKNNEAIKDIETRQIILSALGNSPFSTDIIDQGEYAGVPFVVEEYREKTLAGIIEDNKNKNHKPTKEEIISLGKQLFEGIDYFHRLKETDPVASEKLGLDSLTHSDIKPSNILHAKDARTEETRWEYTDFGIRINTENDEAGKQIVNSVSAASFASIRNKGKDGRFNENIYASPEVTKALVLGQTPSASIQSDLWSIGAVLFAYATGKAPNWGEYDAKEARKDLPDGINEFFAKILNGDPAKRYKTAKEALSGLEQSVQDKVDSYILGIARDAQGQYYLFRQPMAKGKPQGTADETSKWETTLTCLQIIYVPSLEVSIVPYLVRSNGSNIFKMIVYKNDLQWIADKEKSCIMISEYSDDQPVKKRLVEVSRRKSDGKTVIRAEFSKRKYGWFGGSDIYGGNLILPKTLDTKACYELPSLAELGKTAFEETKPTLFNEWEKVENSQCAGNYFLKVNDGKITTYNQSNGRETASLPFSHVTYAVWVGKKIGG